MLNIKKNILNNPSSKFQSQKDTMCIIVIIQKSVYMNFKGEKIQFLSCESGVDIIIKIKNGIKI